MEWFRDHLHHRLPVPPAGPAPAAEGSHTSRSSDVLALVIKGFDVAEKIVDGLPILGLKQVISTIHTILQLVDVKIIHYLHFGQRVLMVVWLFLRNQMITRGH